MGGVDETGHRSIVRPGIRTSDRWPHRGGAGAGQGLASRRPHRRRAALGGPPHALEQRLAELGYVEGRNLVIDFRTAGGATRPAARPGRRAGRAPAGRLRRGLHSGCYGVFKAWKDPKCFQDVRLGPYGELSWGEDIDLCPDAVYMRLTGKSPEQVFPGLRAEVDA